MQILLAVWKVLRLVPGANWLRVTLKTDGHRLKVRAFSYADLLTASDEYEQEVAGLLPEPGQIAVDAGAYIGRHTLALARAVGPAGRVLALEPLTSNFRLLKRNVRLNQYPQVTCVLAAAGDANQSSWIYYDWETSTASLVKSRSRRQLVRQRTLDSLCREYGLPRIDFLKIDTEGNELEVLQGAAQILEKSPAPRLVIELHDGTLATGVKIRQWLTLRGFACDTRQCQGKQFLIASRTASEPEGDVLRRTPSLALSA